MFRPIGLALICLFLIGALLALRTTIAARAVPESVFLGTAAIPLTDDTPPLAKADKLPTADLEVAKRRVSAVPIEVAPAETLAPAKAEGTTRRHWHVSSKISKRTGRPVQ